MKKVLGSISLLVLLFNTLLTPLTYAEEYSEIVETSSENAAEEVLEETGEEEVAPEFSVEENTEEDMEENADDEEIDENEEIENSTGDIVEELTGDAVEIGSGDNTELITGENSELITGETIELATGDIAEDLTGDVEESSGTGEETIVEEIKYNEEPIIGEKTYDDVTVKVEALSGTFPEGTELNISPIRWWNLWNLKDKLVEEKEEIKKDATVVAFDITFIYSGEEVQPKDGEKVKVTFDYSNNKDLLKADKNASQEVKVFHIEEVKDEDGNKTGEEKVVDVTNKEESAENGITLADAESFSVYVVTYVNENPEFSATLVGDDTSRNNNFHYKTITISDGEHTYTLMDRNLGARVAWNTGTYAFDDKSNYNTENDYYGYYYQWGNNYGFSTTQKYGNVISDAIPSNYVSSTWSTSNLGGYNLRGDTTNTESARQGPCPRGWHVPSSDEWEAIKKIWCMSYNNTENCQGVGEQFAEALQMPTAGYRYYQSGKFTTTKLGENGYYWSSTSNNNSTANYLFFRSFNVASNTDNRVNGFPVRCLKNNSDAVTLYLNPNGGKVENAIIDADAQGKVTLPTATKDGYIFDGWFDDVDGGNEIGFSGDEITIGADIDLYAHWSYIPIPIVTFNNGADLTEFEVEDGGTLTSEQIQQVSNLTHTKATFDGRYLDQEFTQTFDFSTPITADTSLYAKWTCKEGYIQLQGNGGPDMNCFVYGTLSYDDSNGKKHFLMDRNLGAQITGFGTEANSKSYGYYYQWGNNYGFGPSSTTIKSSTQVDCTNINPSTYTSSTFITGLNDFDWCSSKNDNLWGGSTDGLSNNRGLDTISSTDLARKGPCPEGWHVPSIGEWQALLMYWESGNSVTRKPGTPFYSYNLSFEYFTKLTNDFNIPIAGQLAYEGAQLSNNAGDGSANLWSSSPDIDSDVWARRLNLNITTFEASANARILRAYGLPVRCFMNELKNTLTLNAGEGTVDLGDGAQSIATIGIVKGESFTIPMPTRSDHSFDGWFIDANENGKYDEGEVMKGNAGGYTIESMDEDLTFTAKWKATITYDGNGGAPDKESDSGQPGDTITLPGATQDGKEFSGWVNSGNNYVGTSGDNYTLSIIETLKALWYDNVVIFVYANGERAADPIFVDNGGNITLPSVASVSGFTFDGWYDEAVGGNKIGDAGHELLVNESRTLYVQGHYDSVELTAPETTTIVGSDEAVGGFPITMTVTENTILETPEGIELSAEEGKEIAGDVTIDFGGKDAKFSHLVKVKIPVKGSSKAYVKVKHVSSESYNYDGLTRNIEASCNDGDVEDSAHSYDGEYMDVVNGYVSIYTCEASNFLSFGLPKVTFIPNNGGESIVVEVESGATVNNEDIPNLSNSEDFLGWYTDSGTFENAFDFNTPIVGDITLYAKWKEGYTVTISSNNPSYGTVSPAVLQDVEEGATISINDNILTISPNHLVTATTGTSPDGYINVFQNWDTSDCGDSITGDCTITGNFVQVLDATSTVIFDANRGTFNTLPAPQTVANGQTILNLPSADPELPGYRFDGWFTAATGGRQWNLDNDVVTGDLTLYAHWTYNLTYGDLDVYMIDGNGGTVKYVMMDRNLGATAIYDKNFDSPNFSSFGFAYQWGNNYGFPRVNGNNNTYPRSDTRNSKVPYSVWQDKMPSKYTSSTWVTGNNPWHDDGSTAIKNASKNLWGGVDGGYEDMQGPCPDGYHLPDKDDISNADGLLRVWANVYEKTISGNPAGFSFASADEKIFTEQFLFPIAGAHKKGDFKEQEQGKCANYTTAATTTDDKRAQSIWFCTDNSGNSNYKKVIQLENGGERNNGVAVRCFKNSKDSANLKIHPDKGTKGVISIHKLGNDTIINEVKDLVRTQAGLGDLIFEGWYTDSDFAEGTYVTGGSVLSAQDTDLYAKWSCPSGYEYNGEICVVPYNITFDANAGIIDVGGTPQTTTIEPLIYGIIYDYSDLPIPTRSGHRFKGWYAEFDGVDDSIDYGTDFKFVDKISVHVSAYMDNWSDFAVNDVLISSVDGDYGWHIQSKEGNIGFGSVERISDGGKTWRTAKSDISFSFLTSGWHDFDLVFDGDYVYGYLDGNKIVTSKPYQSSHEIAYSSNSIFLGATPNGSNHFQGKIKDVIIQNSDQRITSTGVLLVPNQDVTYYALWEERTGSYEVDVTINPVAGGNVTGTGVYDELDVITLTGIANDGYQFIGWYDGSDNLISAANPYIFTADASAGTGLKAVFELKQSSCTLPWGGYLANGESVTGYKTSSAMCPNSCEAQQATCNNGIWNVENFEIIYTNSGCITQPVIVDQTEYPLDNCPSHGICSSMTGYAVENNMCEPGVSKFKLNECVEGYHAGNNECIANVYHVIFDANGGAGTMTDDTVTYGTNYTIKNSSFTKVGSTFSGWNTKADKSGTRYYSGQIVPWSFTGNLTLYAQWKVNTYTVTYDAQSHSGTINNQPTSGQEVKYNTPITLPSQNIKSQNEYTFIGWTTEKNGKTPLESNTYTVTGDITFYPIFKKDGEQKDITFHKNGNSGYRYENHEYAEDKAFSGCSIPTLYNTDLYTGSCSVHITLPDIIAHENTPTVLGWSTGAEERTISYATGVDVTITIPRGKEVELYAQTKSDEKTYEAGFEIDNRVVATLPETPMSCTIQETFNGVQQKTSCEDDLITLPAIITKAGYHSPIWKLGEDEYLSGAQIALSGNVIFTGTATPDEHTPYVVKHYYQSGDTNLYELSGEDTLSGATETILTLSQLQKEASSIPGFLYSKARVDNGDDIEIDITSIQNFDTEGEIQSGLVIQLFYTRKSNPVKLNTILNATVEKIPEKDSYYYGETIIFSGHADAGYTFSGWDISEGESEAVRREGNNLEYTMISTGVEVTPVIREHKYTIHFNGSGAVGGIDDIYTGYSENISLPTSGDIEGKLIYTGHDFEGWTTENDRTTIITEISKAIDVDDGAITLYAKWKAKIYTVTYDYQAHSGVDENVVTNEPYGTEITLPTTGIESQKGYEFTGWTTALNGKEPISNTYTVTGDITFYPIFKKDGEQKDITFHKNGNSGYRYENHEYAEDKAFSGCSIPTLYNTDLYTGSCSVHITLPDIIAHENTPTVLGWSTGAEERTISYATGVDVTITIPRGKEVELYAQTRSVEKEYTATYETDSRVEEIEKLSDTCSVKVTYNGNPQQTVCTEAITLPNIAAKPGYNTPIWKLGETEYNAGAQVYLSGNVIFTGTATPDAQTPYTVKHYYQVGDIDFYGFSGSDTLSGATETLLELSKLQKNPLENTGFTYYKARVNDESGATIDIRNINDFVEEAKIQPGLVIQLFYTRNNNTLTLNTIEHAIVEKSPTGDSYYYGEAITFSGHAEEGYTFSGWSIKEGGNVAQTVLGTQINYTMPSTGVVVTPVIREHSYTIHFDGNGAVGNIADKSTLYSATVTLPTAEEVAGQLTNTGHHFVGWTTGATETTVLTELSKATTDDNGEVTLYAKWDVNDGTQYLVKYYLEPVEEGKPQSEYVLQDIFTGAAPTNSVITGVLKNYDGFTTPLELTGKVAADGSLVIKYYYTRNSYTYTFNAGEGAEFEDGTDSTGLSFRYEQAVNEPGLSVVKPGFTKIGWTPELSVTMPHENKTSTVVWSENHYTIEYDANGGDGETPTQSNIAYTESITLTGNQFVKEGYYFAGWSITKDGEVKYIDKAVVSGLTGVNNAVVKLYAHWEANGYTVTFDANSGDVSETEKNVIYDATYGELPEASRVGYTFKGWYTDKVAGVEVTSGTKVTRTEDHTLYAQWTADTYTVTFNANGGDIIQTEKTVTYDATYGVMPIPTRVGYSFVGWYTEQTGGEKVTSDTKVIIAISHTLYAHWTANKYIVIFDANGGVVAEPDRQVTFDEEYGVLPVPTREGYAFSGWYTQVEGGEYITGTTTVTRTENHTLYAQWIAEKYIVTFDANSGDVLETEKEVIFDEIYGELPTPNRTGYTFQGWYTAKDGGTQVIQSTQVTTANDHTLYAHWLENHYIIAFNANGGEGSMSSLTSILYTETTVLPANKFTRNGYQFNGWSITDVGEVKYSDKAEVSKLTREDNATVTLYAVWQKGAYNISYELNGGVLTGEKTNPVGYDVDTETFTLNNPEKDGYDFLGWSGTGIEGLLTTVIITQGSTGNRVYEANWKPTEYTITYNLSGGELPSGQINPVTYTIESGDITLINPVRTGYDFNGWSGTAIEGTGETVTITHGSRGDRVYEANWKIKKYTITWENSTGVILKQEILPYGVTPDYGGIPTSGADAQYTYTFKSWDPVLAPVTEDQVYTATYNKTLNTYIITFKNEDGTVLYTTGVAYGNTPVFSGTDPQKAADVQYTYTFNGWSPALAPVTGEATYTATYTHTINKYTITFVDENGSELKAGVKYDYGTVSGDIAQPDEPIKTGDAHYSYTFKGWNPELTGVTKDQVYTAVYNQTINSYPITFYDEDGTTILQGPTLYPYGTLTGVIVPVFTPTKTSDGTYTYEFDKWTPTLETVVGTANYTATYKSIYIDYLVTFLDSTGAVLTSGYYHSGDTVTIPASPAKASTAQTGYTFKSWYPEVQVVTGNITYEPTYTETTRSYTITWLSSTGTELRKETLPYGSTPNYGENPTSGSTAEYDYTFNGWAPAIQTVTKDATYTATYNSIKRIYPITWKDADGTEIGVTNVEYGVVPLAPTIPSKDFTEQTGYVFNGWNPAPVSVTKAATYTATYAEYTREYTILWKDYDGTVIKTGENIPYGTLIVNNKPSTDPIRDATAQTGYTFNGWYDEDGVKLTNTKLLTGDVSYTARYDEELRSYTVIWKDWNGTELEKDENVVYGADPQYDGVEPTSGSTAQYVYTFNGWSPGVHSVTGPEVYTASYAAELRSYPITFYDEDGVTVVKGTTMYPYGTPSTTFKPSTNPTKKGYSFEKWLPELESVVGTADYRASYKINSYNVTPEKGVGVADIIGGGTYEYNTVITLTGIAKAGYHFDGGETVKEFVVTVPDESIIVKITADPNTYYIHYKPNGGTGVVLDQVFVYDQEQELSANAYTNEGKYFKEWTDGEGHQYKDKSKVKNLATTGVINLIAIWTETPEPPIPPTPPTPTPTPSPGETAAGGGRLIPTVDEDEHESADLQTGATVETGDDTRGETGGTITRTEEEMDAYKYAYKYGITTLAPREAAMPDDYVQRGHMAKMVVNYSINVLHRTLPEKIPDYCKWNNTVDSFESQEIKDYAEKACALGIMGIDMNYFQPNKYVTRAQFGTIFGRLLRGKLPSTPYYAEHLARLKKEGIMTQIENPEDRIEIRKWAWLMFMRSEKYIM